MEKMINEQGKVVIKIKKDSLEWGVPSAKICPEDIIELKEILSQELGTNIEELEVKMDSSIGFVKFLNSNIKSTLLPIQWDLISSYRYIQL